MDHNTRTVKLICFLSAAFPVQEVPRAMSLPQLDLVITIVLGVFSNHWSQFPHDRPILARP